MNNVRFLKNDDKMETSAETLSIFSLPDEVLFLVFSYLTLNDLKELRVTSKRFNDMIIESSSIKNRSKLLVTSKNVSGIAESIQRDSRLNFRNVAFISVHDCSEMSSIMDAISMDVQHLTLSDARIYETLASVELPNLQRLEVEKLGYEDWSNWKPNAYKNLKNLHLREVGSSLHDYIVKEVNKSVAGKIKGLSLQYENDDLVTSVLKANGDSLHYLSIFFREPPAIRLREEWAEIFQNLISLRTLKLCSTLFCGEWIYEILAALPDIAPLNCISINGECEMFDDIVVLLRKKFQNTLQEANFSDCSNITRSELEELLRVAHSLKKLDISYCDINLDSFTFDSKPMLQELNLSGLNELTENCICYLAEKLPNLVFLNLSNSTSGTTNKSLAYIFRYQTRLRTLMLKDCNKITDKGLMGLGEIEWTFPVPITCLKHLGALDLRGIYSLTDQTFHEAIAFKELRELEMCDSNHITNQAIAFLTVNCPAIERLYLPYCPELTIDSLNIIASNLKRLRKFDLQQSNNFTTEVLQNFYKKNPLIKRSSHAF